MKLIYRGVYRDIEQLPKGALPENAVRFKEAENMTETIIASAVFIVPALLSVLPFLLGFYLLKGELTLGATWLGLIIAILSIFPHEFLHAVCFGKDAEVALFIAPKQLSFFVHSVQPITKKRFIFLSLFPNLVFGWLPLSVWMILPYNAAYSNHLFTFSILSILCGIGDYMNVYNAIRQMPKGSVQQLSGFNSYWYMP